MAGELDKITFKCIQFHKSISFGKSIYHTEKHLCFQPVLADIHSANKCIVNNIKKRVAINIQQTKITEHTRNYVQYTESRHKTEHSKNKYHFD